MPVTCNPHPYRVLLIASLQNTFHWGPGFPSVLTLPTVSMGQVIPYKPPLFFSLDESRGNLLLSLQLPKFNLLEDAHRQLALRIRTVYARTADRIAEELAAAKAAGTGALRLERLERAHTTAQRLASESVEETAAWVKEQFIAAEQGRANSTAKAAALSF